MPPIKDKYAIHSKAIVCQDIELKGEITFGPNTIVYPKASIFAIAGPIYISSSNIIEENAVTVNRLREPMQIEDYTVFFGLEADRRIWSGRGKVQEADLRKKHIVIEYLKETLPRFNRQRKGDVTYDTGQLFRWEYIV